MTDAELLNSRNRAEAFFKNKWPDRFEYAPDFGAYCVEKWLKNPHSIKRHLLYFGIDFFRHQVGGNKSPRLEPFLAAKRLPTKEADKFFYKHGRESLAIKNFDGYAIFENPHLNQVQRASLILYYQWGFNHEEIAQVFGFTFTRASQVLTAARGILSETETP